MPIIKSNTNVITQINLFTVPEGKQQPLLDYLAEAARVAHEVDGWLSASLHRSLDDTRVVNYAQCADREAAQRVFEHLMKRGMIEGNKRFGSADPGLYEVAFTLER